MDTAAVLPHVTASLNAVALVLLLIGFALVRGGRRDLHRKVMLAAVAASGLFLAVYLVYHATAPIFVFRGTGLARPVYYTLLVSHVVLAALVTPMIGLTVWRALNGRFEPHRGIARWTLPIWLYVSVTGVVVYALLYHVYV
jgi:Predicted membrane protein